MSPAHKFFKHMRRRVVFFSACTEQGCVKMRILFYQTVLNS